MKKRITIVLAGLLILPVLLYSQNKDEKSGSGFGGPDNVERTLEEDKKTKQSIFELGFAQPYFNFKDSLKEKAGLSFGLDYSAAYFNAANSLGEKNASSGMVRFYGTWDLIGRKSGNTGAFIFKIEHRHKYGAIPPKSLGFETGYVGLFLPPFSNDEFRMTNLYWRQRFAQGRFSMVIGLLDATDYVDVYALASPWMHFTNFQFSTGSETMFLPNDVNLGIAVAGYITENIYAIAGINDTNSDPTKPFKSFETFFSQSQYFKSVEVGWVSSRERHFFDNIHLVYWHSDGSEFQASPKGWGLNFSGTWFFQDKHMAFLRGGYAEDGGSLLQKSVTTGWGWYQSKKSNVMGAAFGWGEVNESTWAPDLDDQVSIEVFYRLQLSSKLALTPTINYLINPALSDENSNFIWGIRGRLAL